MQNKEIIEQIKNMSNKEQRNIKQEELINIMQDMNVEEIIELSKIIGYPVFARLCMGELNHKFVLLQDGAVAIIENEKGEILLQRRSDNDLWGIPGGCQELGESFEETIVREIKEETNLDIEEKDLQLIDVVSGKSRMRKYPNGDVVINNTLLYYINKYSGELKCNEESKETEFFALDNLPQNQHDADLVERYIRWKKLKEVKK